MRKALIDKAGDRKKFKAQFSRYGKKVNYKGYSEETVLLIQIVDIETNKVVADHSWFNLTKAFEKLVLKEGDELTFEARVKLYQKGYVNKSLKINNTSCDYKLSHPTKIERMSRKQ